MPSSPVYPLPTSTPRAAPRADDLDEDVPGESSNAVAFVIQSLGGLMSIECGCNGIFLSLFSVIFCIGEMFEITVTAITAH